MNMSALPRVAIVVVAAGSGTRLAAGVPKAFVRVAGATLLEHALRGIAGMAEPARVVVVAPAGRLAEARSLAGALAPGAVVIAGGASRQASVAAGLAVLEDSAEIVLVHDAARAFTPPRQFDAVVAAVDATGEGVVPGLPVSDTIKRTDEGDRILETVDRSELVAVQTPQGFPRSALLDAYAAAVADETDDAALLASIGHPVRIVPGDPHAFKITTPDDVHRAEALFGTPVTRIGIGTDTHAFGGDGGLWLAGLSWPGEQGLAGHSDGDAVAHAIVDALLSAAGLGDIGGMFGTDDPELAGARGAVFLTRTRERLLGAGFRIGNVAVQLVARRPRFAARRAEAESVLGALLGAPVSVSATTTDGLGFTGRGEGVTAIATAIVFSGS